MPHRSGERADRNRKITLGRFPQLSAADARKRAQVLIGSLRDRGDPARERARARALPTLGEAVEDWLRVKAPHLAPRTLTMYRRGTRLVLAGWRARRLGRVTREDIASRLDEVRRKHGKVSTNVGIKVLAAVYRRSVVDHPSLTFSSLPDFHPLGCRRLARRTPCRNSPKRHARTLTRAT